jgi:lysyl-tRNA synthetase class 1
MYWADKLAKEIIDSGKYKPYWVDDMKTPSGFAHIGSLRGPLIHSVIYRALKDAGQKEKFTFVFNDFDPVDELPLEFKNDFSKYLGFPLREAPSPKKGFKSMGEFLAHDLRCVLEELGVEAKYISSYDLYKEGKFNGVIKTALENAEKIQAIYEKVSGSKKKEQNWLPFQVVCEKCGKLGTTRVFAWDGKKVSYKCEKELVTWAQGCGYEDRISPFGGTGKLPWKVDWAAHWKVIGVTIEGAGKDHASAGGSYDIAMELCDKVFKYPRPLKLPYEFFLIGGKKMSSSKGLGLKAHDLIKILPSDIGRFLFTRTNYREQVNFDPVNTMAIPDLFDEYDRCWQAYNKGSEQDLTRTFELAQVGNLPKKDPNIFIARFRDIVNYIQMPNVNLKKKLKDIKGGILTDVEIGIIKERVKYAKIWLDKYAPEDIQIQMTNIIPEEVRKLSELQKKYLTSIIPIIKEEETAEGLQSALYDQARMIGLSPLDAFKAIYLTFIGKSSGPQAAWFLMQYPKDKILTRLFQVSKVGSQVDEKKTKKLQYNKFLGYFSIDPKVKELYPSISVGVALIVNARITKAAPKLKSEIDQFISEQQSLTTEALGKYPEIVSYRKLYKQMKVDWHSKRPGPEELLRRIALKKGLYNINTCVDAYNLVVIKNRVSVGTFDADRIKFPTVLKFANERDKILLLGDTDPTRYKSGDLAYYDRIGGYNIYFNYRDSQRTKVTEETKNLWINVDGVYEVSPEKVGKTLTEAVEKIVKYCGGEIKFKGVVI